MPKLPTDVSTGASDGALAQLPARRRQLPACWAGPPQRLQRLGHSCTCIYPGSRRGILSAPAGLAVTLITQKVVELLGPIGYSKKLLVEKWMRDAKINDIYEGTQQINQLIIARRILNYSSSILR